MEPVVWIVGGALGLSLLLAIIVIVLLAFSLRASREKTNYYHMLYVKEKRYRQVAELSEKEKEELMFSMRPMLSELRTALERPDLTEIQKIILGMFNSVLGSHFERAVDFVENCEKPPLEFLYEVDYLVKEIKCALADL